MPLTLTMAEACNRLSDLPEQFAQSPEMGTVAITQHGKPVLMVSISTPKGYRLGRLIDFNQAGKSQEFRLQAGVVSQIWSERRLGPPEGGTLDSSQSQNKELLRAY